MSEKDNLVMFAAIVQLTSCEEESVWKFSHSYEGRQKKEAEIRFSKALFLVHEARKYKGLVDLPDPEKKMK